ncbi:MAG: ankyrin repeat domain-containing protein [Proteobacteria bacterium]|nr:ankyrin repeat domain-containing protein [Pseudomonadota bacterium]MBU1585016.1 ankyrin repeat domain-containing protein [Pseudomonadota bacterium]MBU2628790.1 ankyrin repeat domain-containing protein [Pseudomonadota bacterium]
MKKTIKTNSCARFRILLLIFFIPLLFTVNSLAAELTGTVTLVKGSVVTIQLTGDSMPAIGDTATLFLEHAVLGQMSIGTWKVTKVDFPIISAIKVDATGDAKEGVKAVIQAPNPRPADIKKDSIARPDPVKGPFDTALMDAAEKGSLNDLRQAIRNGANLNAARDTGAFALALATLGNHRDVVAELLKSGADPNLEDAEGRTALGLAALKGHDIIVRLLVEKGAGINYRIHSEKGEFEAGSTALCMAAKKNREKTVELLLALGADPLIEDKKGISALGYAVQSRWPEMVTLLLDKGILPKQSVLTGITPLHIAAESFAPWDICALLIAAGADMNARTKNTDRLPVFYHGVTPLIIASGNIHEDLVFFLLLAGADPSIKSAAGNTALDEIRITKKEKLERKKKPSDSELNEMALIEKALTDIEWGKQKARDYFREKIIETVKDNDMNTLLALDAIGFDLGSNLKDKGELLIRALEDGNLKMAELLLKHGADPLTKGDEGRTPFLMAVYKGYLDLAKKFHEKGADPNDIPWGMPFGTLQLAYEESKGDRREIIPYLIGIGADVNWQDKNGETPLHLAAKKGDAWFFELLIKNGANPRLKNEDGESAFDLAPKDSQPAFIKIQKTVWPPKSEIYKLTEEALETAKKNKDWWRYEQTAQELIKSNDPKGFYAMGLMYHDGAGKDMDYKKALDYFNQGARIAIGDKDLFYMLGVYHEFGLAGLATDYPKAVQWYEKAIKKGSLEAGYRMGKMALDGKGMKKESYKAFVHIQSSAVQCQGYPEAVHLLGYLYDTGRGVAKDPETAKTLYEAAIKLGFDKNKAMENTMDLNPAETNQKIAQAYSKLKNGKDDASFAFIQALSQKGNTRAQHYLGVIYFYGTGSRAVDYKSALTWFHKAAEQGFATAQDFLGYMYEKGLGTSTDPGKSLLWYLEGAKNGNTHAQYILGVKFLKGQDGISQNDKTAMNYFRDAAEKGHASAQDYLGWMYETGKGVAVNHTEAVTWYAKAADQGHAVAQNSLGQMYENGRGVKKSLAKAKEWYKKAADQGDETAKKNLARLQ